MATGQYGLLPVRGEWSMFSSVRSAAETSVFQTVSFQEESASSTYGLSLEADGSESLRQCRHRITRTVGGGIKVSARAVRRGPGRLSKRMPKAGKAIEKGKLLCPLKIRIGNK